MIICKKKHKIVKKKDIVIAKMNYNKFLNSDYWKSVKAMVLARDKYKCTVCGSTLRLEVHHLTYDNHGNEHNHKSDLITVCHSCHYNIHKDSDLSKEPRMNVKKNKIKKEFIKEELTRWANGELKVIPKNKRQPTNARKRHSWGSGLFLK